MCHRAVSGRCHPSSDDEPSPIMWSQDRPDGDSLRKLLQAASVGIEPANRNGSDEYLNDGAGSQGLKNSAQVAGRAFPGLSSCPSSDRDVSRHDGQQYRGDGLSGRQHGFVQVPARRSIMSEHPGSSGCPVARIGCRFGSLTVPVRPADDAGFARATMPAAAAHHLVRPDGHIPVLARQPSCST
jgi:hypothetical protein